MQGQKLIFFEGNGHCCHRPSSNWETNQMRYLETQSFSRVTTLFLSLYSITSAFHVQPSSSNRASSAFLLSALPPFSVGDPFKLYYLQYAYI